MPVAKLSFLAVTILTFATLAFGSATDSAATSPPSADQFALDMDPHATPANTSTSVGSISSCADVNDNGILDADEDAIDAIDFDVVTAPGGIPASNAAIAYTYTIDYSAIFNATITSHTPLYFPGSVGTGDNPPDSDGSFVVNETDPGLTGKSGPGALDRFRMQISSGAVTGVFPVTLSNALHVDTSAVSHVPDTLSSGLVAINTSCPTEVDLKMLSQDASIQPVLPAGFDRTLTIDALIHNNGPDNAPFRIDTELSVPAGCTANGQPGTVAVSASFPSPGVSVPTLAQLSAQILCTQGGSLQITVDSCVHRDDLGGDFDFSNNCDSDVVNFDVDDSDTDGDGWTDEAEDGLPLCDDDRNEDDFDDAVVDDGCPGGPPQAGAFSEAAFNIGTDHVDACGLSAWPGDLISGGAPIDSTDRINVLDITAFLAPVRHLGTSPGDTDFDSRFDLTPGRQIFGDWINVADITILLVITPPAPPYDSARAYGGPPCQ